MRDFQFEDLLKSYRARLVRQGWTQEYVAQQLEVGKRTYQEWENGERIPSNAMLRRIAILFELTDAEADGLYRAAAQVAPEVQNIPFPRNPYFTGRDSYLALLEQHFQQGELLAITQPVSMSGLGGIGKTQLALEYAHRCYPTVYRSVLWANAATKEALEASYLSLAKLLALPAKDKDEVAQIVQAVKYWLEKHTNWLLVLDNVEDLQLVRNFLPTTHHGRVLFTTRLQIVGNIATRFEIEVLRPDEGLHFLLRRSGYLPQEGASATFSPDLLSSATRVVELLGGHPLALDQAGAYIEETGVSFTDYLRIYESQRLALLNERGALGEEHPETVVVTFEASFRQAYRQYPLAKDVLSCCAFLAPDDIPESVLSQATSIVAESNELNKCLAALLRYSLIKRDITKQRISVHRLVQAVVKDGMGQEEQRIWAEKSVSALNEAFPEVRHETWEQCEQMVAHAVVAAQLIESYKLSFQEAGRLLQNTAFYLYERARYQEAEPLYLSALSIQEQVLGPEHPEIGSILGNLGRLYRAQSRHEEAETCYRSALAILEEAVGLEHSETSIIRGNLARLYQEQGRLRDAEPLYLRAMKGLEKALGPEHSETAALLGNLAEFYRNQGRYEEAEPLYQRSLAVQEKVLGLEHPSVGITLSNLGQLYETQGRYQEAESHYLRSLRIKENAFPSEHPEIGATLNNLARLYRLEGRYDEAEPLYDRALKILEKAVGPEHPATSIILGSQAELFRVQNRYEEAEPLYKRALAIQEKVLGPEHPHTGTTLNNLALLYEKQGRYEKAEPLYERAVAIREKRLGEHHPEVAVSLNNLARLYQMQGKYPETESLYKRAVGILEQELGENHPNTRVARGNYASLLRKLSREQEAEVLEGKNKEEG